MSYYTKYRPQTIGELDLVSVRQSLSATLKSGKFAQVYLFTGPKGTGKTSSARILAKVLNCEKNNKKLAEPCNKCEQCRRITVGSSLSCIEMDAASNRGIDDIRTLKERVGLAPAEGRYTVYIIDEVHMLTTEAFNALLKTLEEPPEHAVFMLCTTDAQKIPATVISRCTRVQFVKAYTAEVLGSIQKAVVGEGLQVEAGALELLASSVEGSFRDGMKLLEQVANQSEGAIKLAAVQVAVGADEDYNPQKLYKALIHKDAVAALAELRSREQNGVDLSVYGKRLLELIRQSLLEALDGNRSEIAELLQLAREVDAAVVRLKLSPLPQLVLEAMVVEWCTKDAKIEEKNEIREEIKSERVVKKPEQKVEVIAVAKDAFVGKLGEVTAKWQTILAAVRPLNHSLEALLRSAQPKRVDNGVLQIEAFYAFHKEQLEQERYRHKLEEAISGVLGGTIRLEIVLGERRARASAAAGVDNISGSVEDDVLVKAAEEIFG